MTMTQAAGLKFAPAFLEGTESGLSEGDWITLDSETSTERIRYEKVLVGDTNERHELMKGVIIRDGLQAITVVEPRIAGLLAQILRDRMMSVLAGIGLESPSMFRAQVHLLDPGSFVGHHIDDKYTKEYLLSLTFHFRRDYVGGEFFADNGTVISKKSAGVLVCPGWLGHRVGRVAAGQRKSLVVFLGEKCPRALPI